MTDNSPEYVVLRNCPDCETTTVHACSIGIDPVTKLATAYYHCSVCGLDSKFDFFHPTPQDIIDESKDET